MCPTAVLLLSAPLGESTQMVTKQSPQAFQSSSYRNSTVKSWRWVNHLSWFLGGVVWSEELDSMILMAPIQRQIFYDSISHSFPQVRISRDSFSAEIDLLLGLWIWSGTKMSIWLELKEEEPTLTFPSGKNLFLTDILLTLNRHPLLFSLLSFN